MTGLPVAPGRSPVGRVTLVDPYDPVITNGDGVAYLWPYAPDLAHLWSGLPAGVELLFGRGPWERGDKDPEARQLFVRVEARPRSGPQRRPGSEPMARYENGLTLGEVSLARNGFERGDGLVLLSTWSTARPLSAAPVLVVDQLTAGSAVELVSEPLGDEIYPVSRWRPGDHHFVPTALVLPSYAAGDRLRLGLRLLSQAGEPLVARDTRTGQQVTELAFELVVPGPDVRK